MIVARLTMMGGRVKPYDAEVEYLESTGTQWIDTGIVPTLKSKMVAQAQFNSFEGECFSGIWGSDTRFQFGASASSTQMSIGLGSVATYVSVKNFYRHEFVIDAMNKAVGFDGMSTPVNNVTIGQFTNSVLIFARIRDASTVNAHCKMKCFLYKLYDGNKLVRDFIPVRKGNVGYMYDKVSGKLFGSQGTGEFIVGPDK